jgi:hypothetical protein
VLSSDTDANALFVQGSSGNVGIGTTSPRVKLDLRSDAVIAAPTPTVGIGTSSPDTTTKLTVAGAITVTGANTGHGASRLKLGQDTSAISQIRFYGADNSTAGILQFTGSSADSTVGGERMRLTSSGELLVGTTTSRPAEFTHPAGFSVGGAATGQVQSSTDGDTCFISKP